MKYVLEGREGPAMSFKTGAVAGTYPKPMLALMFEAGGLSVIPTKGTPVPPNLIKMDVCYEEIVFIKPGEFSSWAEKPRESQPKILAVNFTEMNANPFQDKPGIVADSKPIEGFVSVLNILYAKRDTCPWKTIMLDNTSSFQEALLSNFTQKNSGIMTDARQWAPATGDKIRQVVAALSCVKAHVVVLLHTTIEKHELTSVVNELPDVYGEIRENLSKMFTQFFYASKDLQGKPYILTTDQMVSGGNLRGIGAKWPAGLPSKCEPDWTSIYGKEAGVA